MVELTRSLIPHDTPLVTESNAEPYMAVINGYLTLVAFSFPFAGDGPVFAPAFPAIYGGYFIGFGSIFGAADLQQPDVGAARLAANFIAGAQLGWFSLGGVTYGPDLDPHCGPMGTFDLWMNESSSAEVAYLQLLSNSRTAAKEYFLNGRMLRPLEISPAPQQFVSTANVSYNAGPFPSVSAAVWRIDAWDRTLVVITSPFSSWQDVGFLIDMTDYEYPEALQQSFTVNQINPDGSRQLYGSFQYGQFSYYEPFAPRSVLMLEISPN
jgi:hypothetical protein